MPKDEFLDEHDFHTWGLLIEGYNEIQDDAKKMLERR